MSYIGKQPTKAPLTASDIEDGIITAAKIEDGAVVAAEIASNAVTTAKINADAVTGAKIADDAISEEHLDATVITGMTELAATPADTDEFLISDAGTLKRIDYSHIKGGGITEADQFRLSADAAGSNLTPISSNLERVHTAPQGTLGTGMSVSSGIFSFPSTGIWIVTMDTEISISSGGDSVRITLKGTSDNFSSEEIIANQLIGMSDSRNFNGHIESLVDVTNVSNVKVKFEATSVDSNTTIQGDTNENITYFTFIRLGDT